MSRIERALPVSLVLAVVVTVVGIVIAVFNPPVGTALIGSGTVFASVGSVLAVFWRADRSIEPSRTSPENAAEPISTSETHPGKGAGQRLVPNRPHRNGHDLARKILTAFARVAMWVSLLGAAVTLA